MATALTEWQLKLVAYLEEYAWEHDDLIIIRWDKDGTIDFMDDFSQCVAKYSRIARKRPHKAAETRRLAVETCELFQDLRILELVRQAEQKRNTLKYFRINRQWAKERSERPSVPEDGPATPGIVFFRGKPYEISGVIWHFINAVWGKPRVDFLTLSEDLRGDDSTKPGTIRSWVSRANKALRDAGISWEWRVDQETAVPCHEIVMKT